MCIIKNFQVSSYMNDNNKLFTAAGLYYEARGEELRQFNAKASEDEVNEGILADLQQRQEVEFATKLQENTSKVNIKNKI